MACFMLSKAKRMRRRQEGRERKEIRMCDSSPPPVGGAILKRGPSPRLLRELLRKRRRRGKKEKGDNMLPLDGY